MRFPVKTILALLLCLACVGCSGRYCATSFEGDTSLAYGQDSGTINIDEYIPAGDFSFPLSKITLGYTITPQGDDLLWQIKAKGQILGVKDGKAARPQSPNDVFRLYPLKDSHPPLEFTVRTDRLGNMKEMGEPISSKTGKPLGNLFWKTYYTRIFSMVFVSFATDRAPMGAVVSHGQCGLMPEDSIHFPAPDIILSGKQGNSSTDMLVLRYENKSREYKNRNRQKCIDSAEVDYVIDGKTHVVVRGRTLYDTVNGHRVIIITREKL
ncbi:hypothetical protein [Pseudodesulfovibrio sp.]|uniref:hypothetical protein n=1 Tax=unclassified Pseudodesulfovibrio TaxID=2661612 RepID=UPI003B002C45